MAHLQIGVWDQPPLPKKSTASITPLMELPVAKMLVTTVAAPMSPLELAPLEKYAAAELVLIPVEQIRELIVPRRGKFACFRIDFGC